MIIYSGFIALVAYLLYRNRSDRIELTKNLQYYSNLAEQLSGELKAQRELSSLLAHDLKSPLAGIISSAQALELSGQNLPSSYLDCLRLMQVSGRANLRLLSNFIELIGKGSTLAEKNIYTIPLDRKQLLKGLLEQQMLIEDGTIEWKALPIQFKTEVNIRQFSTALAEIIDTIKSQGNPASIILEESFNKQSSLLVIALSGFSQPEPGLENARLSQHYQLALKVMEGLGVEIRSVDHINEGSLIELSLPIIQSAASSELKESEQQVNATVLLELSLQQVRSASLSIGKLSDLKKCENEGVLDKLNTNENDSKELPTTENII